MPLLPPFPPAIPGQPSSPRLFSTTPISLSPPLSLSKKVFMEDPFPSSSFFDNYQMSEQCERSSLGFMELLSMQDFGGSVFDVLQPLIVSDVNSKQESSEVLNAPATPNSCSVSSETPKDGAGDKDEEEGEENQKTKKQLKAKKSSLKKQREPRFAFMTKSEVDHLEDGYRWRKYGQKAVKNSPFPRGYYRCTNTTCNVKKRVERNSRDPSIVVTTYEGQHTHPSPQTGRPALPPSYYAAPPPPVLSHNQQQLINYSLLLNGYVGPTGGSGSGSGGGVQQISFCPRALTDNGLLQDVVPWSAIKKEEQ